MNQPRSRRNLIINGGKMAIGATALGAWLAACGNNTTAAHYGVAAGDINYWYLMDDQKIRDYLTKAEVDAFNAAYPKIHLSYTFKALATPQTVLDSALATGHGPDLVATPGASAAVQYVLNKNLLPLDDYATQYSWKGKMLDWALKSGIVKGKLYSLPTSYETMVIFYNKSLFQKKGWSVPTTRADLETLCDKIKTAGIIPFVGGNSDWNPATEWFTTAFFNHYAGPQKVHDALTGKIKFTDQAFVDATKYMKSYFDNGWIAGGSKQFFVGTEPQFDADLSTGKGAMEIVGTWAIQNFPNFFGAAAKNPDNDWDWFPIPPLSSGVPSNIYTLATGGTISINARSKSPDAAAQYLDWLYSTPKRVTAELADLSIEPLPTVLTDSDFPATVDPRIKQLYTEFGNSTKKGVYGYTTWTFWGPKSDVVMYKEMDKVLVGDTSPADFCKAIDDAFTPELQAGQVPYTIPQG